MSDNIFNIRRFSLLFRQHFIHNIQLLLLSTVAYMGVIFIVLSLIQMESGFRPNDLDVFQGSMIGFVSIFGILYIGHSFPAFRSKESTINYLMVPGSLLEKFLFELISRLGIILVILPLLYWVTFHLQGYFFTVFISNGFEPVGLQNIVRVDVSNVDHVFWLSIVISSVVFLAFVLAFTGAATFSKQPLVKSLFSVALIILFYTGYSYLVIEHLGVGKYDPPSSLWLVPTNEAAVLQFISTAVILTIIIMLFVAYRKLKEKEV